VEHVDEALDDAFAIVGEMHGSELGGGDFEMARHRVAPVRELFFVYRRLG